MCRPFGPCLAALVALTIVATVGAAKPPDLPCDPKITAIPTGNGQPLLAPFWLTLHPFATLDGETKPEAAPPRQPGHFALSLANCPAEVKLHLPVDLSFHQTALTKVLDAIRAGTGLMILCEEKELSRAGIRVEDLAVTLHVERLPLRLALDVLLRPHRLEARLHGNRLCIGVAYPARDSGEEASEEPAPPAKSGESVCPRCEDLHRRHVAGIDAMVQGLMKACYLAVAEGKYDKAANLARQAHAIAPERIEGDPLVHRLHLLREPGSCRGPGCPASTRELPIPPSQAPQR